MKTNALITVALVCVLSSGLPAAGSARDTLIPRSAHMTLANATNPPFGYIQFCRSRPLECSFRNVRQSRPVSLSLERWEQLSAVNDHVNKSIKPVTDLELYKVTEKWTYPKTKGDCEDYVLLKRRMLIERGWPVTALLITVVLDQNDEGHAVLTVRTNHGDLILDNQVDVILPWRRTGYHYIKRQSHSNPVMWVAIEDDRHMMSTITGGAR